jgi:ubiquinone/menaquinone biosynthesis C-methylase UbiE
MNTEAFTNSKIGQFFLRLIAAIMESRLRYRFFGPLPILQGAGIRPGQIVLELGCGTGFFTLPAAQLLGDQGSLLAMDVLPAAVEMVARKVQAAGLKNVHVVTGDALDTKLAPASLGAVLIFGVLPAPGLSLEQLLPEMQRILKPGGSLSVWPPSWVPGAIPRSGLFTLAGKRNAVTNFRRNIRPAP